MANSIITFSKTDSLGDTLEVGFIVSGSAVFNVDYTVTGATTFTNTNGTVTIPSGTQSVDIQLTTIPQVIPSLVNKTVVIDLDGNGYINASPSTVTLTIIPLKVTMPLDFINQKPLAAWSLRQLRREYVGDCIRVKRISDGAFLDVGFLDDGSLDTVSLLTFAGINECGVTIWYDQSGNNFNYVQSTDALMPRIVGIGGVLQQFRGKVGIKQATTQFLQAPLANFIPAGQFNYTISMVAAYTGIANARSFTNANAYFTSFWGSVFRTAFKITNGTNGVMAADTFIHVVNEVGRESVAPDFYDSTYPFNYGQSGYPSISVLLSQDFRTNSNASVSAPSDCYIYEQIYFPDTLSQPNRASLTKVQQIYYLGIRPTTANLDFSSFGDSSGLFYYLGTRGLQETWSNPANYRVNFAGSNLSTTINLSDRNTTTNWTSDSEGYLLIVLEEDTDFRLTDYVIRSGTNNFPRNWIVQGATSLLPNWRNVALADLNLNWVTLDTEVNNTTISAANTYYRFTVTPNGYYRFFRFQTTGNNSGGTLTWLLSELELYGNFRSF
jgi:hypothetical protein